MEDNLRRNIFSPLRDPVALEGCGTELIPTNSDSSAISLDSSKDFSRHRAAPLPQGQSTKWTNQQHSLYINSLEASFVNQLHHSMRLRGWCLQDNVKEANASRALLVNPCNLSEKFLVQQDGCSQKINFEKNEPMLESTADSHVIAGSLLRHHSTNEERSYTVRVSEVRDNTSLFNEGYHSRGNSTFSCETPRSSEQGRSCHLRHLDLAGSNAEVIDQNFEDENRGTKSSCVPEAKKLRTAADDASSNDQVVPLGKFNKADVSTGPLSLENEQHELLSENPESFFFSKSDLHHFLRGS